MPRKPHEKLPAKATELEGLTKAAILLLAVGPDKASVVLKQPPPQGGEEGTGEWESRGRVPHDLQSEVVKDFYSTTMASQYANEGSLDYARQLLLNSLDSKSAE